AIREDCPVKGVEDTKGGAKVVTADGGFTFDRVVVAAGCWMRRVLPGIGAQVHPTRQQMAFYEVTDADTDLFSEKKLPVWGVDTYKDIEHGYGWYGFPVLREGYVKISNDFRSEQVDPDDHRENTKEFLRLTDEFVKQRMPKLAKARFAGGRSCFYEHTSDWDFLIDRAPGFQRVVVAGGGSGHGFKFGGSIGPVIADTVEEKPNALAAPFRVGKRFATLR
ncbi:MAG: FAD-dependent oxidoreductase, partial [SAR202 cluster bacterium]|nr:FAD-dependent oxidoreductase [SAR202 cluster bacterium]